MIHAYEKKLNAYKVYLIWYEKCHVYTITCLYTGTLLCEEVDMH